MTLREYYLARITEEGPYFVRILQALPIERLDYKPDERSQSAHQLAWLLATEIESCLNAARDFKSEWISDPPAPMDQIIARLERSSADLPAKQIARMDEASWNKPAQFLYNGKVVLEQPAGQFLWYILFDAIHHRGQLSAYVRPMGGNVPAIYGDSADEKGGMQP